MKAIIIEEFGDTDKLIYVDVPKPIIQEHELLIRNIAISINPVDVRTRAGSAMAEHLKKFMPITLGWDVAGIVEETGSKVSMFKKGDSVFGLVNFLGHGKAYAEYVAIPEDQLAIKPASINFNEAAAATLSALTAWQLLRHYANVKNGDRILIQAASGGVGHFAVQIAKILGAYVIGVSSSKNRDFVLGLGADEHIAYDKENGESVFSDIDIVVDAFAFNSLVKSLSIVKPGGRIISLLPMISDEVKKLAIEKGVEIHYELVHSSGDDMKMIAEMMSKGLLRTHVSEIFPFTNMEQAHLAMQSGHTVGKIVVSV